MRSVPWLPFHPRRLIGGVILILFGACSAPPVAPPDPLPKVPMAQPSATPGASSTPAASAYLWTEAMAVVARKLRVELPSGIAHITLSDDQRVWLSFPADALFAPGRSALLPSATPWLDRIAMRLRELPRAELQIVGEPDSNSRDARAADAQALDRAASARDWMVARGIAARRIAIAAGPLPAPPAREPRRIVILIGERAPKLR